MSLPRTQGQVSNTTRPPLLRMGALQGLSLWAIRAPNPNLWFAESLCTDFEESARNRKDHWPKDKSTPAKEEEAAQEGDEDTYWGDPQPVFHQDRIEEILDRADQQTAQGGCAESFPPPALQSEIHRCREPKDKGIHHRHECEHRRHQGPEPGRRNPQPPKHQPTENTLERGERDDAVEGRMNRV